jgi:hypothetical protein
MTVTRPRSVITGLSAMPLHSPVANMPRPVLTPASPRRLRAICSRTEGVPEPYWKGQIRCLAGDMG